MIRSPLGSAAYWVKWATFDAERADKEWALLSEPSANPAYLPQFAVDTVLGHTKWTLRRYSRGDAIADLGQHIPGLLDAWELSNRLAADVCREHGITTCRDWVFELSNLNHYNWCFWLVGLPLPLESRMTSGTVCWR